MSIHFKKIAGSSYLNYLRTTPSGLLGEFLGTQFLTGASQNTCTPTYTSAPCSGDCHSATQVNTQIPGPNGQFCTTSPLTYSSDCSSQMPCKCYYKDLVAKYPSILDGGAVTCGDCSTVSSGSACTFYCLNGNPMNYIDQFGVLRPGGLFSIIPCTNNGWPDFDQANTSFTLPICAITPQTCPPVLGINSENTSLGFAPNVKAPSVCIGATQSDTCTVSCAPGFYAPQNYFVATCSQFMRNGVQVVDWLPWNETSVYGHQSVCVCQGCRAWFVDTRQGDSCPCQINANFAPYYC